MKWAGVIPAITTPFRADLSVDHVMLGEQVSWLAEKGCSGVVALGSLGEGGALDSTEKSEVLQTCVAALGGKTPVVAGISALTTAEAVNQAKAAEAAGCAGLMVLPPYVYKGDWREMKAHVAAVLKATGLPAMLYNNPIAYHVDFLPEQVQELADRFDTLRAIKESSADIRRIAALRALLGERLEVLVGVDDLILESGLAGATGWIAGLANAFPEESVALFNYSVKGEVGKGFDLYRWFLPLLRMDTVPKFVQLIKLVQEEVGRGSARVRPPRLELEGQEAEEARRVIAKALETRPQL